MSDKNNVMPNNLDAEQALLGCMLIDNEILAEVLEQLERNDFYQESHQYILTAMKMIFSERKPIDIVTLCDRLDATATSKTRGAFPTFQSLPR